MASGMRETTMPWNATILIKDGIRPAAKELSTDSKTRIRAVSANLGHCITCKLTTAAKKARANDASPNIGTLSMRKRAMIDSVTPTAT